MRRLTLLAVCLLCISCGRERPSPPLTWLPQGPALDKDVYALEPGCVAFVGDSLTHIGWWRKWYPDVPTSNQGIGGNRTPDVLSRLQPVIDARPSKVFVLCGVNDMMHALGGPIAPPITSGNHRLIIRRLKDSGAQVFVQACMPLGAGVRTYFPNEVPPDYQQRILDYNTALKAICVLESVPYLDTHTLMADDTGHLRPEYTADQIHLEAPGYAAWTAFLRPYVE